MRTVTGEDLWEVGLKMGWARGPYEPTKEPKAADVERMAALLDQALREREDWLPELLETEDAMRGWEATTPREYVLRLYKFLNQLGYTVVGIDAAIARERRKA